VKPSLLDQLRSPLDGSPLRLEDAEDRDGEIVAGALVDGAGTRFPIHEGVPLFAEADSDDPTFGFKWRLVGDSYGRDPATRDFRQNWYLERFGHPSRQALLDHLRDRRMILDAGTGSGVDSEVFAMSGAPVVAVDLSRDAALATYRHLGHLPNVHVLQADLTKVPFAPESFDYVSCDQVLHHTPDTRSSFAALARMMAPGAEIAIYVYSRKGPLRELSDDLIREEMMGLSAEECFERCKAITLLGKALTEVGASIDLPDPIPSLGIPAGEEDVQRFVYWNVMKCFWNPDYDFLTNNIVNFDWYHPRWAWRHTPDELREWHAEHGLELLRLEEVRSGIASVGRRNAG
jgi:SAM-dependent methyltransferase/uncharacterized protein YbaR (Trm112 family)